MYFWFVDSPLPVGGTLLVLSQWYHFYRYSPHYWYCTFETNLLLQAFGFFRWTLTNCQQSRKRRFLLHSNSLSPRTPSNIMVRFAANLDMYRKVPSDLLEGTRRGSIMSYAAVVIMATLFLFETRAFFGSRWEISSDTCHGVICCICCSCRHLPFERSIYRWTVDLALDNNTDRRVRVNFNITMCDLKCDFAVSKSLPAWFVS